MPAFSGCACAAGHVTVLLRIHCRLTFSSITPAIMSTRASSTTTTTSTPSSNADDLNPIHIYTLHKEAFRLRDFHCAIQLNRCPITRSETKSRSPMLSSPLSYYTDIFSQAVFHCRRNTSEPLKNSIHVYNISLAHVLQALYYSRSEMMFSLMYTNMNPYANSLK